MIHRLAAVLLACLPLLAAAQVYKWTDEKGRTQYGDKPPEEAGARELKIDVKSYEGPVQVQDWSKIIRAKSKYAQPAATSGGIVMYATSWCPHCKRARAYFAAKGLAYREIDVEASEAGRREFKELGGGGVPLILANGKSMRGFNPARMDAMLK
jgi:glutaredoxin